MNNHSYMIEMLVPWSHYSRGDRIPEAPPGYAHEMARLNRARIIGENGVLYQTADMRPEDMVQARRGPGRPRKTAA